VETHVEHAFPDQFQLLIVHIDYFFLALIQFVLLPIAHTLGVLGFYGGLGIQSLAGGQPLDLCVFFGRLQGEVEGFLRLLLRRAVTLEAMFSVLQQFSRGNPEITQVFLFLGSEVQNLLTSGSLGFAEI